MRNVAVLATASKSSEAFVYAGLINGLESGLEIFSLL
jgi:hypothetical protein